jgi:hypothetical protein
MPETKSTGGRLARWRERRADRRKLRAERRLRSRGNFGDAASRAQGDVWSKNRFR